MPVAARAASVLSVPSEYATIQAAINAAADGDTVLVAPGTYVEQITIDKDITVESTDGADVTTIDGNHIRSAVYFPAEGGAGVLRGFTVQHGSDIGASPQGGGVAIFGGAPLIEQNRIIDNGACGGGGGIAARFSSAVIQDNTIAENAQSGCSGGNGGGGILLIGSGSPQVRRNRITANRDQSGGGISISGSTPVVDGNVIDGNTGTQGGGIAMVNTADAVITNNLITANQATTGGGVYWLISDSPIGPAVVNNTIVANTASEGSGIYARGFDSNADIVNNIVVSSTTAAAVECSPLNEPSAPIITSNDVTNGVGAPFGPDCGTAPGADGNISVDPRFVDPASGDYHLRPDSTVIDAGQLANAPTIDFDGGSRPHDGDEDGTPEVDIGFDEATDPLAVLPHSLSFGEVAAGVTDTSELVTLTNYGSSPLIVESLAISGSDAGDFSIADEDCTDGNGTILPAASCSISVGFTPSVIGDRSASLTIVGPGGVGERTVPLTGAGLDPVGVAPAAVSFGNAPVGSADTPVGVTLSNVGGTQISITDVSLSGPSAADFSISGQTCTPAPIASGSTCSVTVAFKPTAVGVRTATLLISGPSPVGNRTVDLDGSGTPPPSGVGWGSVAAAGPAYTWNEGGALGQTVQSGAQRLHLAYATDRISGRWARDTGGPFAGVYYTRSSSGSSWGTPVRLNPTSQHGARTALSAYGSRVYVAWVSQTRIYNYSPSAPRVLYLRVNTSHGASSSWRTAVRLTSTTGRVDFPSVAAYGSDVHVAWTDSVSGAIRIRTSRDSGVTWRSPIGIGSTTSSTTSGRTGVPAVAVRGSTVAVVWRADSAGTIKGKVSTDRGATWGPVTAIGTASVSGASVAVRGSRIAVAWPTEDDVVVRQRVGGTWAAPVSIATVSPGSSSTVPYAPVVVLQDPSRIGVAWAEETDASHARLLWAESANGGSLWFGAQVLASPTSARGVNDWPSVVWPTAGTRYVAWNGWTIGTLSYRQYIRRGTGAPTGPTSVAASWIAPEEVTREPTEDDQSLPRQKRLTLRHR